MVEVGVDKCCLSAFVQDGAVDRAQALEIGTCRSIKKLSVLHLQDAVVMIRLRLGYWSASCG